MKCFIISEIMYCQFYFFDNFIRSLSKCWQSNEGIKHEECTEVIICVLAGATIEEVQKHWKWLDQNLLPYMAVFENKEDAASFVQGKVKVRPP